MRLSLFSLTLLILFLVMGITGLYSLRKTNAGLRDVYKDRMVPMTQLASIQKLLLTNRIRITASLLTPTPEVILSNTTEVEQHIEEISKIWGIYMATTLSAEEANLAEEFTENRTQFVTLGLLPTIAALRANDLVLAHSFIVDKIRPLFEPMDQDIQKLIKLQEDVSRQEYTHAQVRYGTITNIFAGLFIAGVLLCLWLTMYMKYTIVRPLKRIISYLGQIAQGNYYNVIDIDCHDEIGKVEEGLKAMQIKLGFDVNQIIQISAENLRVKIALDSICTGVMVADTNRNIVYTNNAASVILGKSDAEIRKFEPNFSVDTLLGTSIDHFHQNPAHQAQLLSSLTDTYKARMTLGKCSMLLTANPMFNKKGQRLGTVVEWRDRSAEVTLEKEIDNFVLAAVTGDFSKRFDLQDKEGFFRNLGEDLNQLLHVSEGIIIEVVRVLGAVSGGDLTQIITNDYQGTMGQLKNHVNQTVEQLKDIISQIKTATNSIHAEVQKIAHDNNDVSIRTATQATSLERAAVSVKKMASTVQQNTINARQGNQLAIEASDIAGNGLKVIGQVVATMTDINEASGKIFDIISVIDGIAFQTNILALNAAVEAARAGQEGKGFAVVATEVRSLAQRSALAAGDIKNLIHDTVEKVEDGTLLVAQAGKTMEEMVKSIGGVSTIMAQISMASMDQSFGIEQINLIMTHMEEVTQQNAGLVSKGASAARALEEQAQNLTFTVNSFKVDENPENLLTVTADILREKPQMPELATTVQVTKPKSEPQPVNEEWEEF
jgi:methyl-accepting chemotaxis protein